MWNRKARNDEVGGGGGGFWRDITPGDVATAYVTTKAVINDPWVQEQWGNLTSDPPPPPPPPSFAQGGGPVANSGHVYDYSSWCRSNGYYFDESSGTCYG